MSGAVLASGIDSLDSVNDIGDGFAYFQIPSLGPFFDYFEWVCTNQSLSLSFNYFLVEDFDLVGMEWLEPIGSNSYSLSLIPDGPASFPISTQPALLITFFILTIAVFASLLVINTSIDED